MATVAPDDAPTPALAERFAMTVAFAPRLTIGTLATGGVREHQSVQGGRFEGDGIVGELVGGGETLLLRPDGVGVPEATYLVRTDAGALLRLIGTGYRTDAGPFVGTRMTIVFEVDEAGPHAALSTRAWLAERAAGTDRYRIAEIL